MEDTAHLAVAPEHPDIDQLYRDVAALKQQLAEAERRLDTAVHHRASVARRHLHFPAPWQEVTSDFTAWLAAGNRATGTIYQRRRHLVTIAELAPNGPQHVTARLLVCWQANPRWGANAKRSARTSARLFFAWAHRSGRIASDPAAGLPTVESPRRLPHPTPDAVFHDAMRSASDRDLLMIALGAWAGLRAMEIAHIDIENALGDTLVVTGKGGDERYVPINEPLRHALGAEFDRRRQGRCGSGWRIGPDDPRELRGPLFPGQSRGHITPGRVSKILSRALGPRWTGHSLRHRFASQAYGTDHRDLLAVRDLLGHRSVATTQIYTQTPTDALLEAVRAVY